MVEAGQRTCLYNYTQYVDLFRGDVLINNSPETSLFFAGGRLRLFFASWTLSFFFVSGTLHAVRMLYLDAGRLLLLV